jgi:hypothetical protein
MPRPDGPARESVILSAASWNTYRRSPVPDERPATTIEDEIRALVIFHTGLLDYA